MGAASAAGLQARYGAMDLAPAARAARSPSMVVWASTIGSGIGPNLLQPCGAVAAALRLPKLTAPYLLAVVTLTGASLLISLTLRPDPSLLARRLAELQTSGEQRGPGPNPPSAPLLTLLRDAGSVVRRRSHSLLGLYAVAVGHVAMAAVMVMTPVHTAHVDVSLTLIGLVISVHVAGMCALSPLVGAGADRFGRIPVLRVGVGLLLAAYAFAGTAAPDDVVRLGGGLFLLGLGWSCTLVAGSTMLSGGVTAVERPGVQGLSDLTMNVAGAAGGVIAGLLVAFGTYGLLCTVTAIPIVSLGAALMRQLQNDRKLALQA